MSATTAPRRTRDDLYRIVAVVVLIAAGVVAALMFRGGDGTDAAAPTVREISVSIANRKVSPPVGRVEVGRGSTIRLTITSDVPDELHVHGYDRRATLKPGEPATLEFRADTTGLFEIETHSDHLLLVQLLVR
ncbi:hypothetical protein GCM10010399_58960 [Dactylosporangium fulvum]|uniref:Cupredoxin domain-containing protein n=1 Tax=Dactylosporangium fulvum TaxID=53359 RepID=A0ABY5VND8_9ACTN|nr:cupredoxin domain-containing protein [Dactylosporangium fulvum]UWP78985.1 cupredoxin domain-containing protein [Dactylosporangium fulvum]